MKECTNKGGKKKKGEWRGEKCYAVYLNDGASYCNDEFHPIETNRFNRMNSFYNLNQLSFPVVIPI